MTIFCPAKPEWWTSEVFRPFYLEKATSGDPDSRIDGAEKIPAEEERIGQTIRGGKIWIKTDIPIRWEQGAVTGLPDMTSRDHWHTDFAIQDHSIHVDFVSFFRGGPQTEYREYRVFVDKKATLRAGGFMGFLMGNFARLRNFPLAYMVDSYMIYANHMPQRWPRNEIGKLDYPNAMSIWKLEKT